MANPTGKNGRTSADDTSGQIPRYKVLAVCHLNDELIDPFSGKYQRDPRSQQHEIEELGEFRDCFVNFRGVPGPHLEPVNDAARAMCEKHADRMEPVNPIEQLPMTQGNGIDMGTFAKMVAKEMIAQQVPA